MISNSKAGDILTDPRKIQFVEHHLRSFYDVFENLEVQQHHKLMELLGIYEETELGQRYHASAVEGYDKFAQYFPLITYESLSPYLNSVYAGDHQILVPTPPEYWSLSRYRIKGEYKTIPMTDVDLQTRVNIWPRAFFSFIYKTGKYDLLDSFMINLSNPARVMYVGHESGKQVGGFSSGIVTRYASHNYGLRLVPEKPELDRLPMNLLKSSWTARFKFIFGKHKFTPFRVVFGDADVILNFGRFIKRAFGKPPKRLWNIRLLVCTGTPGIHKGYKVPLLSLFGDCVVLETYNAAEGLFAQQMDESPFVVPNYDQYFFEIISNGAIKPLYVMQPGETGTLVVSTPVLPRFNIGDIIKCMGPNKFAVIGGDKAIGNIKSSLKSSGSTLATESDVWL